MTDSSSASSPGNLLGYYPPPSTKVPDPTSAVIKTQDFAYTADELITIYQSVTVRWRDYALIVAWLTSIPAAVAFVRYKQETSGLIPAILAVVFLTLGILYPYWRMWSIRRAQRTAEQNGQEVTYSYEFEPHFFSLMSSGGNANRLKYEDLVQVVPDAKLFYLNFGPKKAIAIPWRAFQSDADKRQVKQWIEANNVRSTYKHLKVR